MLHLTLALLGPFKATLNGESILPTADRLQALLAYLAVEREREHNRQAVASLLWPKRPDREALASLRYALSHLHRALQDRRADRPFLRTTRHTVRFNRDSDYQLDVEEFQSRLNASATVETLTEAVALYRGEFLEELALEDSPAFEEWQLLQQERFHRRALTALQRLAALYERAGEYAQAATTTRRHLALDPWDETAHRRLMRTLALDGRRSAALAQYDVCRQVLADELRVTVAEKTTELYAQIRDGTLTAPARAKRRMKSDTRIKAASAYTSLPATPFVARERELAHLDTFLRQALAGQGRVIFVTGEAGSGKTALLSEFARRKIRAVGDLLCATGRGMAQAGVGDPFLPFREILQALTGDLTPASVRSLVDPGPALLEMLLPAEARKLRAAQGPGAEAWPSQRTREQGAFPRNQGALFEQVSDFLHAVAQRHPLLMVLDDLQWADQGTVSLLFHLGRRIRGSRMLIVGAYRPADVALARDDRRHPLLPVIHEFQRDWGEIRIELDRVEGRDFVDALIDSEPNHLSEAFREQLHHITEGHALFTVELLRSLRDQGHLIRDATGHWIAGSALEWKMMPARVEAVIAQRLSRLPEEWRALLKVASVQGETFEAELVARVLGADEQEVLNTLAGPLRRQQGLVQPAALRHRGDGQRFSSYRFRHALFQRYLYQELDEAQRAGTHEAVGHALEVLHPADEDLAPQLAWHFERAGLLKRAADYRLAAGRRAYQLSAHEEAIAHYRRGLSLLERLPEPTNAERRLARIRTALALHQNLGSPLEATRGWANAEQIQAYTRAYELAHELAEYAEMAPELLHTFYLQAKVATGRGAYQRAQQLAQQLLALGQRSGDPLALGLAHWALGSSHFVRGEGPSARQHLEEALALYRAQPDRFPILSGVDMGVNCLSWLSLTLCTLGYPEQALACTHEALARAQALDLPLSLGMALTFGGCTVPIYCRQVELVRGHATELLDLARAHDLTLYREWVEVPLGWCQAQSGAFETAIARMRRGIDAWEAMGTVPGQFFHLTLLAEVYCDAGAVEQGLAVIEEALAMVEASGVCNHEPEIHRIRGELLRARDEAAAETCFRRAIEIAHRQEARWWELRAVRALARLWADQGRVADAHARLAEVYGWFTEGKYLPDLEEARASLEHLARDLS